MIIVKILLLFVAAAMLHGTVKALIVNVKFGFFSDTKKRPLGTESRWLVLWDVFLLAIVVCGIIMIARWII